jgi:hypothetical protein
MAVELNVAVQNTVSTCTVLCSWVFVLRCLDVSLLTHTVNRTEIPAVVYSWLQTHLLSTKYAWSTRIAPVVSVSYKSVPMVTIVAVCLLRLLTSANVQIFSDLPDCHYDSVLPDDGLWLYASVCHCMLLYAAVCFCMLVYDTVCFCMILYVAVCFCMLLFASVCCWMLLYVAVCYYMLLYVSVCCCMLLYAAICCCMFLYATVCFCMLLNASVCCCMLLYAAVCFCMLLCAAVCYYMLLYVSVCCCMPLCCCMLLYASVCYCMSLYAAACRCMPLLLYATVCHCMLLNAAVCYCVLLYATIFCMLLCGTMCHSVLLFATVFCCELWQCISNCSCCMLLPICASSILRWWNLPLFAKVSLKINCIEVAYYLSGEAEPVPYYLFPLRSAVT